MVELLPCPFCGGLPRSIRQRSGDEDVFYTTIVCASCFISTADFEDAPDDAATSWDTRVPDPRIAELEARAEKAEAARDVLLKIVRDANAAVAEYFRYLDGGEMRGSYDGRPERDGLRKAGYALQHAAIKDEPHG